MTDSDPRFHCPHCEYVGMEGYFHVRNNHPEEVAAEHERRRQEWLEQKKPKKRPKMEITRKLEFDAGHRVFGHESKCAHIHGHRYVVMISCAPKEGLDDIGRVVDFSVIKGLVGKWIDDELDHGMLLFKEDPLADLWQAGFDMENSVHNSQENPDMVERHKHFIMDANPTAENIAEMIYKKAGELLEPYNIVMTKVVVHETPNCSAEYAE